jgi:hypothetical protein
LHLVAVLETVIINVINSYGPLIGVFIKNHKKKQINITRKIKMVKNTKRKIKRKIKILKPIKNKADMILTKHKLNEIRMIKLSYQKATKN